MKYVFGFIVLFGCVASVFLAVSAAKEHQTETCVAWIIAAISQLYISIDSLTSDD